MKVCIVSGKPKIGGKKKNLERIEKFIIQEKADMYIFGELFLTGYICRDDIRDMAEDIEGPSVERLKKMAKEHDCYIICGVPLKGRDGIIFNAAMLFHPEEQVDVYRKAFLANFGPFEERFYFAPGADIPVFHTRYGKVGLCICFDIFFPELVKGLVLQGADLIVCISASPSVTREFFEKVLPARAIENTVFMAYSNLVGNQEHLVFWGGGQVHSPTGELIARGEYLKEGCVVADIDFSCLEHVRVSRPTIRDTRPDIFLDLFRITKNRDGTLKGGYAYLGIKMGEYAFRNMKVEKGIVYGKKELAEGIMFATGISKDTLSFEQGEGRIGATFIGREEKLTVLLKEEIRNIVEGGMDSIIPLLGIEKIFDVKK